MISKRICTGVRIALSLALLYGVYTETGIWTTIVLFLVMHYIELK